jgi:hypothetical protein
MKPKTLPNIVEHAGSGFLMPESIARRIDDLARGLPRDFTYRRRSSPAADLELDPGERTDVSTITTDALDRDRECVLPAGGDWSAYNRVVPFAHDYRQLPAGSCWWIKPKSAAAGSRLIAKTHYPAKPADWGDAPWLPSAVLHLMQQPVPTCTGKSIGFLPLNIREASAEEMARRPELKGVPIIDRWAGIEYSVVPVPCNPEAEMLAVAKGVEAGVFDTAVAELITKAMTPFLDGWRSPLSHESSTNSAVSSGERETIVLTGPLPSERALSPSPGTPGEGGGGGLGDERNTAGPSPGAPQGSREREMQPCVAAAKIVEPTGVAANVPSGDSPASPDNTKAADIERATLAAFIRPETIRAAIRRAVEDARAELPMLIRAELKEAYARATGKV